MPPPPPVIKVATTKTQAKKGHVKLLRVAIAPYDEMDSASTELLANEFENFFFNLKAFVLPREIMSDSLLAYSKTRYNANKILKYLAIIKPDEANYILAITDQKIAAVGDSIHESGIAGLGNRPGTCAVVSTAALKNKLDDSTQYIPRLIKACFHEMGHNFGLKHCTNKKDRKCLMRDAAGTIKTLDKMNIHLCDKCVAILKKNGIELKKKPK